MKNNAEEVRNWLTEMLLNRRVVTSKIKNDVDYLKIVRWQMREARKPLYSLLLAHNTAYNNNRPTTDKGAPITADEGFATPWRAQNIEHNRDKQIYSITYCFDSTLQTDYYTIQIPETDLYQWANQHFEKKIQTTGPEVVITTADEEIFKVEKRLAKFSKALGNLLEDEVAIENAGIPLNIDSETWKLIQKLLPYVPHIMKNDNNKSEELINEFKDYYLGIYDRYDLEDQELARLDVNQLINFINAANELIIDVLLHEAIVFAAKKVTDGSLPPEKIKDLNKTARDELFEEIVKNEKTSVDDIKCIIKANLMAIIENSNKLPSNLLRIKLCNYMAQVSNDKRTHMDPKKLIELLKETLPKDASNMEPTEQEIETKADQLISKNQEDQEDQNTAKYQ